LSRRLRSFGFALAIVATLGGAGSGDAATLDRVRASGVIRCGAVARPGLIEATARGAEGLLVDLCRAIGAAAAGPSVKVEATAYESGPDFAALRAGRDDVDFLSGGEIFADRLAGLVVPGPPVFFASIALMVPRASTAERPADLAGQPICFLQGDASHRALEAYFAERRLPFERMGFQEEDELYDAFDAGHCLALAGEATTLAAVRLAGERNRRGARILAEPLARFPILAAAGPADAAWAAVVFWTLESLVAADRAKRPWSAGGADSLPIDPAALGLAPGSLRNALAATGTYSAILRRNVGEDSPLALPLGANALVDQGGLLAPPYAE
jgi:general L-amino acid transport system substrate-binding protein